jgi:hypothetical protein
MHKRPFVGTISFALILKVHLMCERTITAIAILLVFIVLLMLPAFLISDGHPEKETRYDLTVIAEALIDLHNRGEDVTKYQTLSDFMSDAQKLRVLYRTSDKRFTHDYWHHPLHWLIQIEPNGVVVTVLSDGRNGKPEGGAGDDISVIINLPRTGQATFRLNPSTH